MRVIASIGNLLYNLLQLKIIDVNAYIDFDEKVFAEKMNEGKTDEIH
jgi:hypothetical protein